MGQISSNEFFARLDHERTPAERAARDKAAIMENTVFDMPSAMFPPFPPPARNAASQEYTAVENTKSADDIEGIFRAEQAFAKLYNSGQMPSLQSAAQSLYSDIYAEFFPADASVFNRRNHTSMEMARFHRAYELKGMSEDGLRAVYNRFMGIGARSW